MSYIREITADDLKGYGDAELMGLISTVLDVLEEEGIGKEHEKQLLKIALRILNLIS